MATTTTANNDRPRFSQGLESRTKDHRSITRQGPQTHAGLAVGRYEAYLPSLAPRAFAHHPANRRLGHPPTSGTAALLAIAASHYVRTRQHHSPGTANARGAGGRSVRSVPSSLGPACVCSPPRGSKTGASAHEDRGIRPGCGPQRSLYHPVFAGLTHFGRPDSALSCWVASQPAGLVETAHRTIFLSPTSRLRPDFVEFNYVPAFEERGIRPGAPRQQISCGPGWRG